MTTKYEIGREVPLEILTKRLDEISDEIIAGKTSYTMRVPAEVDFCPDLVIAEAARRLTELQKVAEDLAETVLKQAIKISLIFGVCEHGVSESEQ